MSGSAAEFAREAPGVASAESVREGEFVHVYEGHLQEREDPVRFLTIAPERNDGDAVEAFRRTAGEWANASTQPNVVSVFDRGDEPRPWIAVDSVAGRPLDGAQPSLSPTETKAVISDAAEALRNAVLYNTHHTDLRPDRVWVVPGEAGVTGLVDEWGLERAVRVAVDDPDVTLFTAPELVDNPVAGDERTDVYGLGALTYFALTGQPPVTAGADIGSAITAGEIPPPSEVAESLSADVDTVVMNALATDPSDRPESVYAFKRSFAQAFTPQAGADSEDETAGGATADATAGEPDTAADRSETDDGSLVSRRAALGMLGVGVVGLGGGWMVTQMGGDSDDSAGLPAPTDTDVAATPADTGATATPAENIVFEEKFEDGEYADTFDIATQQSDTSIGVTGENPRNGSRSLTVRVGSTGQGDIVLERAFTSSQDALTYAAWIYPNSEDHNIHFNLKGTTGSADISFNAAQQLIYRTDREIEEHNRDRFGNPILHESPDVDTWYRTSITAYLSDDIVDFEVSDADGNRWTETGVPATTDFDMARLAGTDYHGNYTFYVDDVVLRAV